MVTNEVAVTKSTPYYAYFSPTTSITINICQLRGLMYKHFFRDITFNFDVNDLGGIWAYIVPLKNPKLIRQEISLTSPFLKVSQGFKNTC